MVRRGYCHLPALHHVVAAVVGASQTISLHHNLMVASNTKWSLKSNQTLHFRFLSDECIVYNSLSGDTHLLDLAATQILQQLQQAPSDTPALARLLAPLLQTEMDGNCSLQVEHLLADLDTLGLIERS